MKSQFVKSRLLIASALALSALLSPFAGTVAEATTITAKTGVNLRSSGSIYSAKIGFASAGTTAKYLGMSNGFYKVSVNGKIGYTYHSYWKGSYVTSTANVNMRTGPRLSSAIVTCIPIGSDAKVLGRNGEWLYIEYNGRKGFSRRDYWFLSTTLFNSLPFVSSPETVQTSSSTSIGLLVVDEARKLIGAPYIINGESWSEGGFDCSGLTQYVYGRVGYDIPRTVTQQWNGVDTKISPANRLPGDIVVITNGYSISHAGIYIGNGQMIHSPKPGDYVRINSLTKTEAEGRIKGYLRPYWD